MRRAHRTFLARLLAAFLVVLAASPLTAPFTTCDLSDFTHDRPVDVPHPGHDLGVPGVKITPSVTAAAATVLVTVAAPWTDLGHEPPLVARPPQRRSARSSVLRI